MANYFYRDYFHTLIMVLIVTIFLMLIAVSAVLYQVFHRPLPSFIATTPSGQSLTLTPQEEPNLLPPTLLKWASKAAVAAYTFDFVNYPKEMAAMRSYFTGPGWQDYQNSVQLLLQTIVQNQLFVSSVVSGAPVIANQGNFPGHGYVWRVQMPFLVTYQSANDTSHRKFTVVMTIVKVSTWDNSAGIGIDQFIME